MSSIDRRILLNITMLSSNDPEASRKADETFYRLNNILSGGQQLPNIKTIFNLCSKENTKLGAYIRNRCLNMIKDAILFDPTVTQAHNMLNHMDCSSRKQIRIVLFPGSRNEIEGLDIHEATHNMIIQFDNDETHFRPTEAHTNPPSFYQKCGSIKTALLYLEALMVDACFCHYLGISDVAASHSEKQQISSEKVSFLLDLCRSRNLNGFSLGAQDLLLKVASKINSSTPYISFLSIFTVALQDLISTDTFNYFHDYCRLWSKFQEWYYKKHYRFFSKDQPVEKAFYSVFYKSRYRGQISKAAFEDKLKSTIERAAIYMPNPPFDLERRYAVIVVKRKTRTPSLIAQFDSLFSGDIYQAKWDIVYWGDLEKYANIISFLDIFPIMIG